MFQVIIAGPARNDIQQIYSWWRQNRSSEQAERWYDGIFQSIATLSDAPDRFPKAAESRLYRSGLRVMLFGIGARHTHRIVFTVQDETVTVLRIRHFAQQALSADELN